MNKHTPIEPLTEITDGLSRRDALKLMGISPFAASLLAGSATEVQASSDAKGKIVILGGGAGGIMTMARLRSALSNPDITIVTPNEIHLYQPGQVFIAAGEYAPSDIEMSNKEFIPDDVKWIKDEAKSVDPDKNTIMLRSGEELNYDYLVVATGIQYHYEQIEGLTKEDIGKNGISSVYLNELEKGTHAGGELPHPWFKELKEAPKGNQKPVAIYTPPTTPIKCGGEPQKTT